MSALRFAFIVSALMLLLPTGGTARAGGRDVYNAHCAICHQANGNGVVGMYPPLADSIGSYVALPAGRTYLVHVVSFGLVGPVSVHGQGYSGVMQAWPVLKHQEVADVLNFALTTFNAKLLPKNFTPLTAAEVKKHRDFRSGLGDVHKERDALIKALSAHQLGGQ
ncbi:MAG TPA: cytochrome c [Candidatus Binataceae bacterium]|nr:cytochrome c [Candidatus Binataceae bacterium]